MRNHRSIFIFGKAGIHAPLGILAPVGSGAWIPVGRYGRSQTVLVQNAGNDEFFLPSDTWFFWDEMFGEKYLKESYHFIGGTPLNLPKQASGGNLGGAIEHFPSNDDEKRFIKTRVMVESV